MYALYKKIDHFVKKYIEKPNDINRSVYFVYFVRIFSIPGIDFRNHAPKSILSESSR